MPKYAIGIVGQMRSFYQKNVYENILAAIDPIRADADVFFCFGEHDGADYLTDNVLASTFNPISTQRYDSRKIEAGNKFYQGQGLWMARGWITLYHQILEQEEKNNSPYELIIKLRPDIQLGVYFHDNMGVDVSKSELYSSGWDDAGNVQDWSAIITRSALKAYLYDFYHDFYHTDAFMNAHGPHAEAKLAWTLAEKRVYVGVAGFKERMTRQYDETIHRRPEYPLEITRKATHGLTA